MATGDPFYIYRVVFHSRYWQKRTYEVKATSGKMAFAKTHLLFIEDAAKDPHGIGFLEKAVVYIVDCPEMRPIESRELRELGTYTLHYKSLPTFENSIRPFGITHPLHRSELKFNPENGIEKQEREEYEENEIKTKKSELERLGYTLSFCDNCEKPYLRPREREENHCDMCNLHLMEHGKFWEKEHHIKWAREEVEGVKK